MSHFNPPVRRTRRRRRHGSSLIQTAVVMPVLLAVVMGTVEFGQYLYIKQAFGAAARDAARQAGLGTVSQAAVVDRVRQTLMQANVLLDPAWVQAVDVSPDGLTVRPVADCGTVPTGDRVRITVATTYGQIPNGMRFLYQMFGKGIGPDKPIGGTATAVRE